MNKQDALEVFHFTLMDFYYASHAVKPFGLKVEAGRVSATEYTRRAWRPYVEFLVEELIQLELPDCAIDAYDKPKLIRQEIKGLKKPQRREIIVDKFVEACGTLGLDPVKHLGRFIAVVFQQYLDTSVQGSSQNKAVSETEILRRKFDEIAPLSEPHMSEFNKDQYARYARHSWMDFYRFSCGACVAFASALSEATGWKFMIERPSAESQMFFDASVYHAWVVNDAGKAIDIFGVRDSDWAECPLTAPYGKAQGEVLEAGGFYKTIYPKSFRRTAIKVINDHLSFYGLTQPISI